MTNTKEMLRVKYFFQNKNEEARDAINLAQLPSAQELLDEVENGRS